MDVRSSERQVHNNPTNAVFYTLGQFGVGGNQGSVIGSGGDRWTGGTQVAVVGSVNQATWNMEVSNTNAVPTIAPGFRNQQTAVVGIRELIVDSWFSDRWDEYSVGFRVVDANGNVVPGVRIDRRKLISRNIVGKDGNSLSLLGWGNESLDNRLNDGVTAWAWINSTNANPGAGNLRDNHHSFNNVGADIRFDTSLRWQGTNVANSVTNEGNQINGFTLFNMRRASAFDLMELYVALELSVDLYYDGPANLYLEVDLLHTNLNELARYEGGVGSNGRLMPLAVVGVGTTFYSEVTEIEIGHQVSGHLTIEINEGTRRFAAGQELLLAFSEAGN
jgi:hypothetical protein